MLTVNDLQQYTSEKIIDRGRDLYYNGNVGALKAWQEDSLTHISSSVISSHRSTRYRVDLWIDSNQELIDYTCDCPYCDENMRMCKHIVATLLKMIYEYHIPVEPLEVPAETGPTAKTVTSPILSSILSYYSNQEILDHGGVQLGSNGILAPVFHLNDDYSPYITLEISQTGTRSYFVRNIEDLIEKIQFGKPITYGKSVHLQGDINAFVKEYRPFVQCLCEVHKNDQSLSDSLPPYYHGYSAGREKSRMYLSGVFLDLFFQAIRNIPFKVDLGIPDTVAQPFTLSATIPPLNFSLTPSKDGSVQFGCTAYQSFSSAENFFIALESTRTIYEISRSENQTILPLLEEMSLSQGKKQYIASEDLPAFTRYIWPILNKETTVTNEGFDPNQYAIPKPTFSIYLDQPNPSMITANCLAVYNDKRYQITRSDLDPSSRDLRSEGILLQFIQQYIPDCNPENGNLELLFDEDELYTLLSEGIPAMQDRCTVYISDSLKSLKIRPQGSVNLGVSVHNGLLELSMHAENLTDSELSEILSRYRTKKKFVRLKNGDFIHLEDSIQQLVEAKADLQLSSKDIKSGTVAIPAFRALYLDASFSKDASDNTLQRDESFRSLVNSMKSIGKTTYEIPAHLQSILHEYQKNGFYWLSALRDAGFAGLLADEMGLGKTLQVITFLAAWKDRKRTLVVCPASLVYNWGNEIVRFAPELPVEIISGTSSIRKHLIENSQENAILVTSYNLLQKDIEVYQKFEFSCQVIDEAQYIKNGNTLTSQAVKGIQSAFRIALTGTPIENRLSELWSIFDYMMPGFLYRYQKFRNDFESPIVNEQDTQAQERLQRMVSPFILRRLKKEVLTDLPDKLEEVIYADLNGEQEKLYQARVQTLKQQLSNQSDSEFRENKIEVLSALTRLRQLCCGPELIYEGYQGNSSKEEVCLDMIQSAIDGGHKVLLFSQFTTMLEQLEKRLDEMHIDYHVLTGATPKRMRMDMVDAFQKDDVPVFCISLKAGGTGLNLTAADVVIHYDPWWNTAVENQASDRAHRIGQTNTVTVYRIILKGTIEEKIIALQESKKDLADSILSSDTISSSKLSREDLLQLL